MQITTKLEFDNIMLDPLTNISTTIEFPGGTVDWQLNISKPCTIFGNNTIIDVSGDGHDNALVITAAVDISDLTVLNSEKTAILINNVDGARFEKIRAGHSNYGWLIKDSKNLEFEECESYNNNIGFELQGSSSIMGNIDSYQELGLNIQGEDPSGLLANKKYYFKVNDKEYELTTSNYITFNNLVQQLNDSKRTSDGQLLKAEFLATLTNNDVRITSLTNSSTSLGRGTNGKDLFRYIAGFDTHEQLNIECLDNIIIGGTARLQSKYWILKTFERNYYIWYNSAASATAPYVGTNPNIPNHTGVEVRILDNNNSSTVAQKTKEALDTITSISDFLVSINNNILTIFFCQSGNAPESEPGNIGFTLTKTDGAVDGIFDLPFGNTLLENRTDRCQYNTILNSLFYKNAIGIKLVNANNNEFTNCQVYQNSNIGIWQLDTSHDNIYRGEIYENIRYGARNTDRDHLLDLSSCWWGDLTGPSGSGRGVGDKISNYIKIDPWLQSGTEPELTYPITRGFIWNMLGYPQVAVELTEDQVSQCISLALEKFHYYWQPEPYYHYMSIGEGQYELELPVNIPKESIIEVIYAPQADIFAQLSGSGESFFLTYYMQQSGGTFLADFYVAMSYKETFERTLGIVPSYEFLSHPDSNGVMKDYIRLYPRPSTNAIRVGLKVSRQLSESEVDQDMWIRKYALAWAKQMLGQIRSKFSSVPGPTGEISLKGSELISEGKEEQEKLEMDLIKRSEPLGFITG